MAPNPRPLWLLDFDGTISASPGPRPSAENWDDWQRAKLDEPTGQTALLTWSPSVVKLAHEAIASGIEVVWLSEHPRNPGLEPMVGLPTLRWIQAPADASGAPTKLAAARKVAVNRPLIWTDEELVRDRASMQWARARRSPTLAIATDFRNGITPSNAGQIRRWIATHQAEAAAALPV